MPYLHFESDDRRAEMSNAIKEAASKRGRTSGGHDLSPDEMLIRAYLHANPSLHVRRTLDQFYYHGIDTDARDQDQVVYRYLEKRRKECKIYMVDQLWLWILGKGNGKPACFDRTETDCETRFGYHELSSKMAAAEERPFEPTGWNHRGHEFQDEAACKIRA